MRYHVHVKTADDDYVAVEAESATDAIHVAANWGHDMCGVTDVYPVDEVAAASQTYHQVTTPSGNTVITRLGADYALNNYGDYGPVREVRGRDTDYGFAFDPADLGGDLRGQTASNARAAFADSPEAQEYARAADWAENGNPQEGDRPHSHSEYQWQDGKLIRDPGILSDPPWEMPDVRSSARPLSGRTPEEIAASVKAAMLEDAHESAQSRWADRGYHSHRVSDAHVRD